MSDVGVGEGVSLVGVAEGLSELGVGLGVSLVGEGLGVSLVGEGLGESEVGVGEGLSDVGEGEDESLVGLGEGEGESEVGAVGVAPELGFELSPLPPVVCDGSELSCWLPAPPPVVELSCRRNRYAEALGWTFPVRGTARFNRAPQGGQVSRSSHLLSMDAK